MTPAQKTLDELSDRYSEYLIEKSHVFDEVVDSDEIKRVKGGMFIPQVLWDKMIQAKEYQSA